ncbi:hypothetical protein PC110_g22102 [Phytophthora cactorum]|uniref:Ubiquitin-like protease family profile domain-containing protein n=1 Tax=Phytophthora cactorum TaxID=29920 RepID=A0A329R9X3_9STRA|nr:hypothetical protein PC110_g22102 [Phytophthora cactorum]
MVGSSARDRMLNDLLIDFNIRYICTTLGDCYAMNSFAPTMGCPNPPKTRISTYQYVVLPVHLSGIHWGIILTRLAYKQEQPCITPYYYEPLCGNIHRSTMEDIYLKTVAIFLPDWQDKTIPNTVFPSEANCVWLDSPKQPDGTSCCVLCIAQVYAMLKYNFRLTSVAITKDEVAIMRLRIMWVILMQPEVTKRSNKRAKAVEATGLKLFRAFQL